MPDNPGVPLRSLIAVALLLAAAGMPQALQLGAHALEHHEHGEEGASRDTEQARLALALVHGHEHAAADPDHEHDLLPAPPAPRDARQDLPVAEAAFGNPSPAGASARGPGSGFRWESPRLPGSSPPPLLLLCTLLI